MAFTSAKREPPRTAFLCQHFSHFLDHFWGSAFRWPTWMWLILSRFLPFTKAFEPFVNTFSAHGFPPVHLHRHFTHLRYNFPQFVTEIVCTLLHCAVTLPITLTTFNWPQSVYTVGHVQSILCVDSPHVSEEPCACAHTCDKLPFRYDTIHRTFWTYLVHLIQGSKYLHWTCNNYIGLVDVTLQEIMMNLYSKLLSERLSNYYVASFFTNFL